MSNFQEPYFESREQFAARMASIGQPVHDDQSFMLGFNAGIEAAARYMGDPGAYDGQRQAFARQIRALKR